MTMHEPLKAHPKAAHHCHHHLKRPVVIIARDTAAKEAVGPKIDGARAVKELKGGAVLPAVKVAAVVKAIVRAVVNCTGMSTFQRRNMHSIAYRRVGKKVIEWGERG
jgi:hypothetical protein